MAASWNSSARAAESVRASATDIEALAAEGQDAVEEIEGVGDAISSKIVEYFETGEIDELEELREEARQAVDKRYGRAYQRLRDRLRDGRAVVPLKRGAAAGFAVPPQRQVEIRQRNRIIVCEHTGRIIVDKEQYEDIIDNMEV